MPNEHPPIIRDTSTALNRMNEARSLTSESDWIPTNPLIANKLMRAALKASRKASGMTLENIAARIEFSVATVMRIEKGEGSIKPATLHALLTEYNVGDEDRERILALRNNSRTTPWWNKHKNESGVSEEFLHYIGSLIGASALSQYANAFVPELLQTPAYARSLHAITPNPPKLIAQLQAERAADPLPQFYVLDEPILRRPIGSPIIMADQLEHILTKAQQKETDIWVIPLEHGYTHGNMPFSLLSFPSPDMPQILYNASPVPVVDKKLAAETVEPLFSSHINAALSPADSIDFIQERAAKMRVGEL